MSAAVCGETFMTIQELIAVVGVFRLYNPNMNKAITKIALLLITIGTPYFSFEARACSCGPRSSPYREYNDARAVFVGKAVGSKDVAVTERIGDKTLSIDERVFQFSVVEVFKGPSTSTVEIGVGAINSSCYSGFAIGESYLVYAFGKSDDDLGAGMCTRTTNLSDAAGDLHYIRELLKGVPEPRVYGSVVRVDSNLDSSKPKRRITPVAGIKILIEGKSKTFEAVTDQNGFYSLNGIPDGKFTARPVLPDKYTAYYSAWDEFVLGSSEGVGYRTQNGPNAYVSFHIGWNNRLNGRVVDAEGNPIVRANVSVLLARSSSPLLVHRDASDYRPNGKFEFDGLNPGKYLLSAEIRAPFTEKATTFYYTSASSLDQAREISIGDNETIEDREIRLPPGYVVRQLEGDVVWPNGVPVSGAWVCLTASKYSSNEDQKFGCNSTDLMGKFSLQAFVGAEYWIYGRSNSSGKGEPTKLTVHMNNEPLRIVIPLPKRLDY